MADQFLGQLMLVGFNFAPIQWMVAAGQILPISQYAALFSLLGTTYGGNGTSNFALPDLQGNVAIGFGQSSGLENYVQGETGGETNVTLQAAQTLNHTHLPMAASHPANPTTPANNAFAESGAGSIYSTSVSTLTHMNPSVTTPAGGNLPHDNMMPYVGLYWIICMHGIFPTRG